MAKRLSLSLDDQDERLLAAFARGASPERTALEAWATERDRSLSASASEAAVIRMLMRAGMEALQARTLEHGYAELADVMRESAEDSRAARERYAARAEGGQGRKQA
jgi:hypothetical protein